MYIFQLFKRGKKNEWQLGKKSDNLHKMLVVLEVHIINQIMWTKKSVRFREIPSSDCEEIGVLGLFNCQMTIDREFTTWKISLGLFAIYFDYIKGYILREIAERPVSFNEIENKNTLIKKIHLQWNWRDTFCKIISSDGSESFRHILHPEMEKWLYAFGSGSLSAFNFGWHNEPIQWW